MFAPLASFSPEWQAVRWANAHGVPVEAIDLPLANTLAAGRADDTLFAHRPPAASRPIRSARWRRPPASPTPNAGGTT